MKIFGVNHVWISSERVAKDLLEGQRSVHNSDRPAIRNVVDSKGSGDYLPLLGHNGMYLSIFSAPLLLLTRDRKMEAAAPIHPPPNVLVHISKTSFNSVPGNDPDASRHH